MKLGILQLHITADIADNKTRLAEGIIDLAHRGAELIVLQELHNTLYFCQVEDVENFNLAEPIPGPSTDSMANSPKTSVSSSSLLSLSAVPQVSITTRQWSSRRMAPSQASTARCTSPTTQPITRSFILHRAT